MSEFGSREITIKLRLDWLVVSYLLHFAAFVLILYMWNRGDQISAKSEVLALSITMIEVMLAILAIFLGVIAFSGFWMIRREAVSAAEDAAVREVRRLEEEGYLQPEHRSSSRSDSRYRAPTNSPSLKDTAEEDAST